MPRLQPPPIPKRTHTYIHTYTWHTNSSSKVICTKTPLFSKKNQKIHKPGTKTSLVLAFAGNGTHAPLLFEYARKILYYWGEIYMHAYTYIYLARKLLYCWHLLKMKTWSRVGVHMFPTAA